VLQLCLGQKLEQYKNWVGVWGSAPNERRSEACCWGAEHPRQKPSHPTADDALVNRLICPENSDGGQAISGNTIKFFGPEQGCRHSAKGPASRPLIFHRKDLLRLLSVPIRICYVP